jgi:hypothetical protein
VTTDVVLDWISDILTTYRSYNTIAISTLYRITLSFPARSVFTSSCLVTAYNNSCSSASWLKSSERLPCQSQSHIATDGQSVSKSLCRAPSGAHDQIFITVWQLRSCFCGAPSLTRGRVCLLYMLLALASAVFLGSESLGTQTIFYSLRFETSLFVASYHSQGHGGGIRPRLHTGFGCLASVCLLITHLHEPRRKHRFQQ